MFNDLTADRASLPGADFLARAHVLTLARPVGWDPQPWVLPPGSERRNSCLRCALFCGACGWVATGYHFPRLPPRKRTRRPQRAGARVTLTLVLRSVLPPGPPLSAKVQDWSGKTEAPCWRGSPVWAPQCNRCAGCPMRGRSDGAGTPLLADISP